ncbi:MULTISPECIES: type I restriction-modification system subunit M [unclassified Chryseobacterium]|uniref:type I restriction-modification system subunit M n=1 Tax=unclassified Chryseobacterium TaxID=2593645 RepID=UPI000D398A51|nr:MULTISPECIES: type I restriction-modification system subunit M [unclassified Chryseobacterium]PTT66908.1 type I restriction-modification system subunit M [Chryseobacterium sp. HMWF001]PVV57221.1 type I restriction-modification system subunit M [Chryseobacterium sp. HMWF035]
MNKQKLAAKIWASANQMRSKIEANEYKDYILGFIFYKYLSEKELQFAKKEDFTDADIKALSEEDTETVEHIKTNIGYFIAYKDLFSTWINMGKDFDVANVRDALSAFSRLISPAHKKLFDGIFETLQTGLSKLGDNSASQTKAISGLLQLIKDIPMDGKQDYDVLGFIYEYLIEKFAANAGKKAGEFYTPHEVSVLMSEIIAHHLRDKKEIQIYDPTSGSGSLLINIGSSVAKHIDDENNIKYYAQELKENTYNLTRMNLVMRGILPNNIVTRNGDTLEDDWPYFDENDPVRSYNPLYVDAVVSNPPYSQKWDSENKEADPRYSRFGLAPKAKADYAFLLHDLYHIKPDGIMAIVLPHGVLFRGGEESVIREKLIEANHIDAIIGLPPSIFFGTGIPTIIMILKQKRANTDVLIIDASKGFVKEGKNNKLRASDIKRIADTVRDRVTTDKFAKVVTREEIRNNEYNLNIPRYVDSSENPETWDIYASMFGGIPENEIDELQEFWEAFPKLRNKLFAKNSPVNSNLIVDDIISAIKEHESVQQFLNEYNTVFGDFNNFLKTELLTNVLTVKINKEKTVLSDDIFKRLENIKLIDKYEAYQLLDNEWGVINVDLEIIQTEGFETVKKVDPNMVTRKKGDTEQEIQDGWVGRIMPFLLVQETYLKKELSNIKDKENKVAKIAAEYEELLDKLSEEDKESDLVNDAQDAFVNAMVVKEAKIIRAEQKKGAIIDEESFEWIILKVDELISKEKTLKSQIKSESAKLIAKTKETIENLTDEQVFELLELKWIVPVVSSLNNLPETIITQLTHKVQALADKYAITYSDVAKEIKEAESTLSLLIGDLEGNEFDMKGLTELKTLLKTGE